MLTANFFNAGNSETLNKILHSIFVATLFPIRTCNNSVHCLRMVEMIFRNGKKRSPKTMRLNSVRDKTFCSLIRPNVPGAKSNCREVLCEAYVTTQKVTH